MTKRLFISGDVEASGQVPGLFDMISIGLVVIEPSLTRTFYGEFAPVHDAYQQSAYDSIGVTREQHLAMPPPEQTTFEMLAWVDSLEVERAVFVSDNPGFDFAFLSWYCWKFANRNPFGHSARRIGDFNAGLKKSFLETNGWKKFRKTKHNHNALADSTGNAEAVLTMFERHGVKTPW